MKISNIPPCQGSENISTRLQQAKRVWLFLDYDGTLSDFAPTPEHIEPNPEVLEVLDKLKAHPDIRITVVSGRRLSHVKALLPLEDVMLAGTYGIEMQTPSGRQIDRLDYKRIRPTLEEIKPQWEGLISGREGFFLEDKGWSLAIHAKNAGDQEAARVLDQARVEAGERAEMSVFRILGGHKFLEIGPKVANKGKAVEYMLEEYPWAESLYVYIGDDDKDEEAFEIIQQHGGIAILVPTELHESRADCRLESPVQVRQWLQELPSYL